MERLGLIPVAQSVLDAFAMNDPEVSTKARENGHIESIAAIYRAIAHNDFDALMAMVDSDVVVDIYAPAEFPFIRHANGIEEVHCLVTRNFSMVAEQNAEVISVVAQGDAVVMVGKETGKLRESGRPYDVRFMQHFIFRRNRLYRFLELAALSE